MAASCTQPVAYPRSAHVQDAGGLALALRSNVAHTQVRTELAPAAEPAPDGATATAADRTLTGGDVGASLFGGVLSLPFSAEGQGALGVVDGLELSALLGPQRGGLELRVRLLEERARAEGLI